MGNYFPVQNPATNYYFIADSQVTGGDPLEFTGTGAGDGHIQRFSGGKYAGIAGSDAAPGASRAVYVGCAIFYGVAEGAVSSGDKLAASSVPGHQVKVAGTGDEIIGKSFGNAADGGQVHWKQF